MGTGPHIDVGDVLEGKYEIVAPLGSGSMGLVYEAVHRTLNRKLAVKTLRAEIAQEEELVGRFEQEARAASAIGHPNIVQIFDAGRTPDGVHYIIMERLVGRSLYEALSEAPIVAPERAVDIAVQTLSALGAAHASGIVHRDLKPENIFLGEGSDGSTEVKLLDFGISKVLARAEAWIAGENPELRATRMGAVMGTPLYMSPEQARGDIDVDHRVDLWSVATVLYEMLCGRTPFAGENYHQILAAILLGEFAAPRELRPAVPVPLEQVILRGLAADRDARWPDAASMRAAAVEALRNEPTLVSSADAANTKRVSGALDAASASPTPEDEARYLSALANISEASLDGGHAGDGRRGAAAVVPIELEDPAPARTALPARERTPAPELRAAQADKFTPPADPFTPPADTNDELDIDVRPVMGAAAFDRVVPGARPSRQRSSASSGSGVRVAAVIKWVVVLSVLLVGAGVVYRYHRLGYWGLSAPRPKHVEVHFELVPSFADVLVDGELLPQRTLRVLIGAEHRLEFRASGRLRVQRDLVAEPDSSPTIRLRLPLAMPPLDRATAAHFRPGTDEPETAGGYEQIDGALSKIGLYEGCLARIAGPLAESHQVYAKSVPRRWRREDLPVVLPLATDALTECRSAINAARERQPSLEALDAAGAGYIGALEAVVPASRELRGYLDQNEYERDRFVGARLLDGQLRESFELALARQRELIAAVLTVRPAWQRHELAAVRAAEGESLHWHLRRMILASEAWVLAVESGARKELRERLRGELAQAHADAAGRAEESPDEREALRGAAELLSGARAVVEATEDEAIVWHNQAVELFNALIVR